jgi:hypothetical protein
MFETHIVFFQSHDYAWFLESQFNLWLLLVYLHHHTRYLSHSTHDIQLFTNLHPETWKMKYNKVKHSLNQSLWWIIILDQQKITICIVQCCLQVFWIRCRSIDPNHHINIILHPIYITEVTKWSFSKNNLRKTTPPILFIWTFNNIYIYIIHQIHI